MGAWIETDFPLPELDSIGSHPSWVRGLKLLSVMLQLFLCVAPLVGAWIETTKEDISPPVSRSRTPRGCVD